MPDAASSRGRKQGKNISRSENMCMKRIVQQICSQEHCSHYYPVEPHLYFIHGLLALVYRIDRDKLIVYFYLVCANYLRTPPLMSSPVKAFLARLSARRCRSFPSSGGIEPAQRAESTKQRHGATIKYTFVTN